MTTSESRNSIRVLIADEQQVLRFGLAQLLRDDPVLRVVTETGDLEGLERAMREFHPDVVVVDPYSDAMKGIEALNRIFSLASNVRVIIYTSYAERLQVVTALELGVSSYLLKQVSLESFLPDLQKACSGTTVISSDAASMLVEHIQHNVNRMETDKNHSFSARELQVLEKLVKGMSNRKIADGLSICEATVKFHVHAILEKLGVRNRTEAAIVALERQIIKH